MTSTAVDLSKARDFLNQVVTTATGSRYPLWHSPEGRAALAELSGLGQGELERVTNTAIPFKSLILGTELYFHRISGLIGVYVTLTPGGEEDKKIRALEAPEQ